MTRTNRTHYSEMMAKNVSKFECGRVSLRIHDGITAHLPNIEKPLPLNSGGVDWRAFKFAPVRFHFGLDSIKIQ